MIFLKKKKYIGVNNWFYNSLKIKSNLKPLQNIIIPEFESSKSEWSFRLSKPLSRVIKFFIKENNFSRKLINVNTIIYLGYLSEVFNRFLTHKLQKLPISKYNIFIINLKSRQFRLSIMASDDTIFNLSVGRVLASLNLPTKSRRKSNKGDRLFLEYITHFFNFKKAKFGFEKLTIIKIIGYKKGYVFEKKFLNLINSKFQITNIINEFRLPNKYSKLKRVRSIKRRLLKRIVKDENLLK